MDLCQDFFNILSKLKNLGTKFAVHLVSSQKIWLYKRFRNLGFLLSQKSFIVKSLF